MASAKMSDKAGAGVGTVGCSVVELSVRCPGPPRKETSRISWTPKSGAQGRARLETGLWASSCHRQGWGECTRLPGKGAAGREEARGPSLGIGGGTTGPGERESQVRVRVPSQPSRGGTCSTSNTR